MKSVSLLGNVFFHQIQTCSVSGYMIQNRIPETFKGLQNPKKEHFNFYFKKIEVYFLLLCMCVCLHVGMCWYLQKAGEDVESPGNGSCELSNVGVLT